MTGYQPSPRHAESRRPFPNGVFDLYGTRNYRALRAELRESHDVWVALKALAAVFEHEWLQEQTYGSHPIAGATLIRGNFWRLLRLGRALECFPPSKDMKTKLLTALHFESCVAELDFGFLLKATGYQVVHEPLFPSSGPDFWATQGDIEAHFEIKCPHHGPELWKFDEVALAISRELSAFTSKVPVSGWGIELEVAEDVLAAAAEDASGTGTVIESLKRGIAEWASKPRAGRVMCPLAGTYLDVSRRSGTAGTWVEGPGYTGDSALQGTRLQKLILQAADQLKESALPGFVVFGDDRHGMIGNHTRKLCHFLRETPELAHVSGLLIHGVRVHQARLVSVVKAYNEVRRAR